MKQDSGAPYATLRTVRNPYIEVWLVKVDGQAVARNILAEKIASAGGDVLVEPGPRHVQVSCFYKLNSKYNAADLMVELVAGKTYVVSCTTDRHDVYAIYKIVDETGKDVPFKSGPLPLK